MKNLLILLCGFVMYATVSAQNPRIDPSFAENGYFFKSSGVGSSEINDIAVQPDGKIVAVGSIQRWIRTYPNSQNNHPYLDYDVCVMRFYQDGRLDSSFAGKGFQCMDIGNQFPTNWPTFELVKLDQLNRIYAYGTDPDSNFLVRFLPNGKRDTSFGSHGILQTGTGTIFKDIIHCMLVDPQNRVILAGENRNTMFLERIMPDGTPDSTFGLQGKLKIQYPNQSSAINDMQWQHDSLLLLGGYADNVGELVRLLPDGAMDPTFSQGGQMEVPLPVLNSQIDKIWVFDDHSFWVAGNPPKEYYLTAFLPNGALDTARFFQGHTSYPFARTKEMLDFDVNPKKEVFITSSYRYRIIISKYDAAGNPDSLFGYKGQRDFIPENRDFIPKASFWQHDGHLLILGDATPYLGICKIDSIGNLSPLLAGKGYTFTPITQGGTIISNIQLIDSQELYYAGSDATMAVPRLHSTEQGLLGKLSSKTLADTVFNTFQLSNNLFFDFTPAQDQGMLLTGIKHNKATLLGGNTLIKLDKNGKRDASFGLLGEVIFPDDTLLSRFTGGMKVLEQKDRKILVASNFRNRDAVKTGMAMFRFHPDGEVDTSFNHTGYFYQEIFSRYVEVTDMVLLEDDKILFSSLIHGTGSVQLIRLRPNGTPDMSFGDQGTVVVPVGPETFSPFNGGKLALRENGKILGGGSSDGHFFLFQLSANGDLDLSFGSNGLVTYRLANHELFGTDMVKGPTGEVYIAGWAEKDLGLTQEKSIVVSNMLPDGRLNPDFGQNGYAITPSPNRDVYIFDMELSPSGDFYLAGSTDGQGLIMHFLHDFTLSTFEDISPNSFATPLLYPNPIRESTNLTYELTFPQQIEINLLDLSGKKLATLASGSRPSGKQDEALVIPSNLPKGWIILQFKTQEGTSYIKAVID